MSFEIPWLSLAGGGLIGLSASLLLALDGRIAGISSIVGGLLPPRARERAWRAWFVVGLLLGAALSFAWWPGRFAGSALPPLAIVGAGLLVGFGARLGGGCTSGHGVCGISRTSARSLAATATFVATGMLATYLVRHVLRVGGP